jgi:hypothetical protein
MVKTFTANHDMTAKDLALYGMDHIDAGLKLFTNPIHLDSGGYLIHIGFECLLKGWWLELQGTISAGHDLNAIANKISDLQTLPTDIQRILELVNDFGQLRYPNHQNPIEVGTDQIEDIYEFLHFIRSKMPSHLHKRDSTTPITKGRRILMKKKSS